MPQRLQAAKIVGRGAADAEARRIHRRFYTKSAGFMATPGGHPAGFKSNPARPGGYLHFSKSMQRWAAKK